MASIKYFIRNQSNPKRIYLRLTDGRQTDLTISTGYIVNEEHWNKKEGWFNKKLFDGKINLENQLTNLTAHLVTALNNNKDKGIIINPAWLKNEVLNFKNPSHSKSSALLITAIENYRDRMETKVNPKTQKITSALTIKNFDTTIYRLTKFEAFKGSSINLKDVDLSFHDQFRKFASNELNLSINSIGTTLKQIKTVCLDAVDRGLNVNPQVNSKKFNAPKEKTLFVTLNHNDLKRIKEVQGSDYINNARDWLLIGCWTGCRVSDLMKLTTNNILTTTKGIKFLRYTQNKTGKQVDIPIHDDITEIINRLNGFPRPISDVKFNLYIKQVCKLAKINEVVEGTKQNSKTHLKEIGHFEKWELIRSHTCRRSFATNHYNKLPNKVIMAVTAHSTEKMLLDYIGETQTDHLEDYLSLWKEESIEQKNIIQMSKKAT